MNEISEGESTDRFVRQAELVPRDRLRELPITVVGVGAIGRQVAWQLAALGVRQLTLIDHDTVDDTNRTTQGYSLADVGEPKVTAVARAVAALDPEIKVTAHARRFLPPLVTSPVVFCCVDSIATRSVIWRSQQRRCQFWADGRMRGEALRVLAAFDTASHGHYTTTLFAQHEAQVGNCTSHGTLYGAAIAAGLMVSQFVIWLRGQPVDADLSLNLLAGELVVG